MSRMLDVCWICSIPEAGIALVSKRSQILSNDLPTSLSFMGLLDCTKMSRSGLKLSGIWVPFNIGLIPTEHLRGRQLGEHTAALEFALRDASSPCLINMLHATILASRVVYPVILTSRTPGSSSPPQESIFPERVANSTSPIPCALRFQSVAIATAMVCVATKRGCVGVVWNRCVLSVVLLSTRIIYYYSPLLWKMWEGDVFLSVLVLFW